MPLVVFVPVGGPDIPPGGGRALLVSGDRIVLGRGPSADVRLPDASVSTRHATVRADGARWLLQDERSRNGTALREPDGTLRPLEPGVPTRLEDGAWVRLGRVWVRLFRTVPEGATECRTPRDLAASLVSLGLAALGRPITYEVRFVDGPSPVDPLPLLEDGVGYVAGRGEGSHLLVEEADVSRTQCALTRRGAQVFVTARAPGTLLGGRELPLGENALWNPKEFLQLGRSLFALVDPVAGTLDAIERDGDVGVPPELLPPCPADDPSVVTPPVPPVEALAPPAPEPTPPPPPVPAPARPQRAPRELLSRAEFTVVALALAVLVGSLVALTYVLRR